MFQLYGDGIHDDAPAIQELIDSGVCEITLPAPKKYYLISKTLLLPSNFRLVLPRFAEIRLADGANCPMVTNRWVVDRAKRLSDGLSPFGRHLWSFINHASPRPEDCMEHIEIKGGIWNCNNKNQKPNPGFIDPEDEDYSGIGMVFFNLKHFTLSELTLKDPVTFAVCMDTVSYFTVKDILFDFNFGNPSAVNMDGIHINGNCHHGFLQNLKGACYDDLVALNAYEGSIGPISHITVDGIFAESCHSAVRLLSGGEIVSHVHITNVHGTYYQYCIALSRFYPSEREGGFDSISIDHVYASKAARLPHLYPWPDSYVFPLFWVEAGVKVKHVTFDAIHRRETDVAVETFFVGESAEIGTLILRDITVENHTGKPLPFLVNHGRIGTLDASEIRADGAEESVNDGVIDRVIR